MPTTPYATQNYTHTDSASGRETVKMCGRIALACSHSGPCDEDVARCYPMVHFLADDAFYRGFLASTGGWSRDELVDEPSAVIRSRVLWLAACDIAENPTYYA